MADPKNKKGKKDETEEDIDDIFAGPPNGMDDEEGEEEDWEAMGEEEESDY